MRPGCSIPPSSTAPTVWTGSSSSHVGLAVDGRGALRRVHEPEQHPQRGGLSCAVRAEEADHAALVGGERELVDGQHRAEALGEAVDLDRVRHCVECLPANAAGATACQRGDDCMHRSTSPYSVPREDPTLEGWDMVRGVKTGVSIALVGILAGGGGAYAATQITSAQIKDGTIQAKDIKRGTITTTNLSAAAKKAMTGPAGAPPAPPARPAPPDRGRARTVRARLPGRGRRRRATRARPAPQAPRPKGDKGDKGARARRAPRAARSVPPARPAPQAPPAPPAPPARQAPPARPAPPVPLDLPARHRLARSPRSSTTVPNDADDDDTWINVAVATCPAGQIADLRRLRPGRPLARRGLRRTPTRPRRRDRRQLLDRRRRQLGRPGRRRSPRAT